MVSVPKTNIGIGIGIGIIRYKNSKIEICNISASESGRTAVQGRRRFLRTLHFKPQNYHDYADRMQKAAGEGRFRVYRPFPLEQCWLYRFLESKNWLDLPPATAPAADRYPTAHHFMLSNVVQHSRSQWLIMAADEDRAADVLV